MKGAIERSQKTKVAKNFYKFDIPNLYFGTLVLGMSCYDGDIKIKDVLLSKKATVWRLKRTLWY